MTKSEHKVLLISRDDILAVMNEDTAERVFRLLAILTRQGYHFLVTAPQPEQWGGEHGSPDDALLGPNSIRKHLADAGAKLDGVYYLRRSLLTQRRNREDALEDILRRYGARAENCIFVSSGRKLMASARGLGFQTRPLDRAMGLQDTLEQLANAVLQAE